MGAGMSKRLGQEKGPFEIKFRDFVSKLHIKENIGSRFQHLYEC
jgi:hypothetical protein